MVRVTHPARAYADVDRLVRREPEEGAGEGGLDDAVEKISAALVLAFTTCPCPCASGELRSRCCGATGPGALALSLAERAVEVGPDAWAAPFQRVSRACRERPGLFVPTLLYGDEAALAPRMVKQLDLSSEERALLEAERASWLAPWEVTAAQPSEARMVDLLTGTRAAVSLSGAASRLQPGDVLLARVVTLGATRFIGAADLRRLPVDAALTAVIQLRRTLRARGALPPAKLRSFGAADTLIQAWDEAYRDHDDGRDEPLPHRFRYEERAHDWVLDRLAPVATTIARDGPTQATVHLQDGDETVAMTVADGQLTVPRPSLRAAVVEAIVGVAFVDG